MKQKAERHKEKMKMFRVNILSQLRLPRTVNSNTGASDKIHLILRKKITLSLSFRCQKWNTLIWFINSTLSKFPIILNQKSILKKDPKWVKNNGKPNLSNSKFTRR